ncbi:hypothetical protein ACRQ5Q_14715 [Bradyrhizobium sp. PMVTL-01]|uniref:hypothetical protein n=1 Tax=Bradyrhizobium sp. PMVTL-01 TaxID=3434999 RepID=UPI003F70DFFD
MKTIYRYDDPQGRGMVRLVERSATPPLVVILDVPGECVAWAPFDHKFHAFCAFANLADRFIADAPVSLEGLIQ